MNNDLEQYTIEKIKHLTMAIDQSAFTAIRDRLIEEKAIAEIALKAMQAKPVAWEVKGILCHTKEEADVFIGEPEPLYDTPPANSPEIQDGWKLVPIDPTDEQLRLMLAARYPATFREHLRNPLNGPKSRVEAEMLIVEVTNQYKNALSAAPKPESE